MHAEKNELGRREFVKRAKQAAAAAAVSTGFACLSEDGDTFVIRAGPEFRRLGKNSPGELCMATPAIVRDGLIIRTESHLLRIK